MEYIENDKPGKYSLVTGKKIKTKSLSKLKRKHKKIVKEEIKQNKILDKKKKKLEEKLNKQTLQVTSVTMTDSDIDNSDANLVNTEAINQIVASEQKLPVQEKILIARKTEKDEPVTLKRKFMNMLSYALVGFVAIFFGYISGNLYVANVLNKVDYGAFDEQTLRDDARVVYEEVSTASNYERINAGKLFVACEYVLNNQEVYSSIVQGAIEPGISIAKTQTVYGHKNKNGNIYEVESISKGMLAIAESYTYDTTTKMAKIYKASKVKNSETAEYPTNPTWVMTYDEYRDEYGTAPENPCIPYIISSKTVLAGTEKVEKIAGGKYKITFSLTTDSSVINYVKQVKHMSGLSGYPTFKQINVTAVIDSDLRFISLRFDEAYTVMYAGVAANCTGYVNLAFSY